MARILSKGNSPLDKQKQEQPTGEYPAQALANDRRPGDEDVPHGDGRVIGQMGHQALQERREPAWKEEERNVFEDYIKAFGEIPSLISGVAIMTDSDNTGESAVSFYGDIYFESKKQSL